MGTGQLQGLIDALLPIQQSSEFLQCVVKCTVGWVEEEVDEDAEVVGEVEEDEDCGGAGRGGEGLGRGV